MMRFFNRGSGGDSPSPETPSLATSSPVAEGPARPIRFVYCDEKGRFQIDPEALAVLQLVKEPVGVVSVCGRARHGKSFILNQLLGRSSGFQVASTHRPCIKGLWLWSVPLRRKALDGSEYNLLLLDTEGIDACDQTGTYSTQIISLAVLLSSMFIYNQMGGIDEAALHRLSLVTEMTKHIRVRASGGRNTTSELGHFSPIFVWLLRDFYLDLVEDNRKLTPRDYLELTLSPVQAGGTDVAAKNEIRESIRALFPDRECFTLVRPLSNENDLPRLDQIQLDKLRPEFSSGLDALMRFVLERTRPKQIGATVMTGPILARITQSFLDAINKGAVPTITSSWQLDKLRPEFSSGLDALMRFVLERTRPKQIEATVMTGPILARITQSFLDAINKGAVPTITSSWQAAESKVENYELELSSLKLEIRELSERLESANATAQSFEREAQILEQEKAHIEQSCRSEFNRFEEVQERCKSAEREAKRVTELADNARAEAAAAQKEKGEIQRMSMERLAQIERAERHVESLERQKADLANEVERYRAAEMDAISKLSMLERRVEKEIDSLLQLNNEQRAGQVQVLETLLEAERQARAEATNRAEALSIQLQATQGLRLDATAGRIPPTEQLNCGGGGRADLTAVAPKRKLVFIKVDQLKPGTIGHNIVVKVINSNLVLDKKPRSPKTSHGGPTTQQNIRISETLVGDDTGTILFTARNDQVDLMKPGNTVILRNAKINMFRGFMRLAVDKWGRIEVTEPAKFVVKEDNNLSLVEYELLFVPDES